MTFLPHNHTALARPAPPLKRRRRTATSVLAGEFDPRPERDVLSSVLNGVKPYRPPLTERDLEEKRARKDRRREREKLEDARREQRRREKAQEREHSKHKTLDREASSSASKSKPHDLQGPKDFWSGRPSMTSDATPDDLSDHSSSMSYPSSKRPYTPPDEEMGLNAASGPSHYRSEARPNGTRRPGRPAKKKRPVVSIEPHELNGQTIIDVDMESAPRREPKKRVAHKKGWKGWVAYDELNPEEAGPDPNKLIELDRAIVLEDRRTRSGKNFDAIGEGKDTWV
jgi:hypothetical protein